MNILSDEEKWVGGLKEEEEEDITGPLTFPFIDVILHLVQSKWATSFHHAVASLSACDQLTILLCDLRPRPPKSEQRLPLHVLDLFANQPTTHCLLNDGGGQISSLIGQFLIVVGPVSKREVGVTFFFFFFFFFM